VKPVFKNDLAEEQLEELFHDDNICLAFLAEVKWENGFTCRKCGNNNWCAGNEPCSRRCTRCKTKESATTGTIFHGLKFPLSKAFYIAYMVCKGTEEVSTYEFARRLSLRQMTCWKFKTRIKHALGEMDSLTEAEKSSIQKILGA
jgi:two-component system, sensor histidine kinase LadS